MKVEGVGRRYHRRGPWVLRDVELEIPPGTLIRVEGANGSGKSTLLRVIAGINPPTAGRVTGRPHTAYVPERFPAALPFHPLGYLTHLGRVHGLQRAVAAGRASEWLERFAIGGYATTPLERLSKGTAQKVAVIQALLPEPGLLVLDEAWTGLDRAARATLDEAVLERVAAGGRAVFVDHGSQRLADAVGSVQRVERGRVTAVTTDQPAGWVLVEAEGRGELPLELVDRTERLASGRIRVVVPADGSDWALRLLLAADPAWHVVAVRPVGKPRRP